MSCFSSFIVLLNLESDVITEYLHVVLEFSLTDNLDFHTIFPSFCFISMLICTWMNNSFRLTALGNVNVLVYRALSLIFLDLQVSTDGLQESICDPLLSNKYLCRISVCLYNHYVLRRIYNFLDPQRFCVDKGHVPFIRGLTGVRCGDVSSSHSDGFYISRLEFIFLYISRKCNLIQCICNL